MKFFSTESQFKYFEDYISNLLINNDEYITFKNYDSSIELPNDNNTNIFIYKLPKLKIENSINNIMNIFILNTEQLSRTIMKELLLSNIKLLIDIKKNNPNITIGILDYSIENYIIIKDMISKNNYQLDIYYIPYQFNNKENKKLVKFSENTLSNISYTYTDSKYRFKIINQLKKKYTNIEMVHGWNDKRDIEIGKSKVLLNIHYDKTYNIFESLRCDRWIFSGKIILSENCLYNDKIDLKDFIFFEKYENLVDKTKDILENYKNYLNIYEQNKDKLNQIILNRKKIYDDFRKIYN